jgi:dTDP-L-rhamnose 4-epimerase
LDNLIEQVHGRRPQAPPQTEILRADIRDEAAVRRAVKGQDAVIHLAAEVGVGQSMYEIARYVGTNDLGTAVLLQALIDSSVERIVVASSMSVYGEGAYRDGAGNHITARRSQQRMSIGLWDPIGNDGQALQPVATDESKAVDLASIYALTKYVQEQAVLIFGRTYGISAVALRLFNVFGPGQALSNPYTGVLANFGARLINGYAPTIFEDGLQRRDFVHVSDVARAFRLALEQPAAAGQTFNIGSGRAYAIREVATLLAAAMGKNALEPEILGRARAGDIRHCFADIDRAQNALGYEPRRFLEDSLEELVAWLSASEAIDSSPEMRQQLNSRGLIS